MNKKCGMSLIELLTVVLVAGMIFALVGRLFTDGWWACRNATVRSNDNRLVVMAARQWREDLRKTDPSGWAVDGNTFHAGNSYIRRDPECLVFGDGRGSRAIHLAPATECVFAIERNAGLADCAVMTLTSKWRLLGVDRTDSVRIVGCGRGNG